MRIFKTARFSSSGAISLTPLYKLSVMVERNHDMTYVDIGHSKWDDIRQTGNAIRKIDEELLWILDSAYQIHTMPATVPGGDNVHGMFDAYGDDEEGNPTFVAKGRYVRNETYPQGLVSLSLQVDIMALEWENPRRYEYVMKHIEQSLEEKWGNAVQIMPF